MNSKQKGNIAIGVAIAYYTLQGYTVSIPLNDSQDYDLVVDIDGFLNKIQVKYTSEKRESGSYRVGLRSVSGSSRQVYKNVGSTDVDYLFIYTEEGTSYIIPLMELTTTSQITLSNLYDSYKIN